VKGYHRYVFDAGARRFVGAFEEMYQAEATDGFDSWHQDDQRDLARAVALTILARRNFSRVLDLGCGKGAFTHQLWRHGADVVGVDLSETAVTIARARFPDIRFVAADVADPAFLAAPDGPYDLAVSLELLSYVESWRALLRRMAAVARFALVGLYVPDNPIGFVKSIDELAAAFGESFDVIEDVRLTTRKKVVLFGSSRAVHSAEGD
jgi:trans-aconitate methyltransferase